MRCDIFLILVSLKNFAEGEALVETYIAYADAALGVIKQQTKNNFLWLAHR